MVLAFILNLISYYSPPSTVYLINSKWSAVTPTGHTLPCSCNIAGAVLAVLACPPHLTRCAYRANFYSVFKLQSRWHIFTTLSFY